MKFQLYWFQTEANVVLWRCRGDMLLVFGWMWVKVITSCSWSTTGQSADDEAMTFDLPLQRKQRAAAKTETVNHPPPRPVNHCHSQNTKAFWLQTVLRLGGFQGINEDQMRRLQQQISHWATELDLLETWETCEVSCSWDHQCFYISRLHKHHTTPHFQLIVLCLTVRT